LFFEKKAVFLPLIFAKKLVNSPLILDKYISLHPVFHEKALDILKRFLVIGGMPAVVAKFVENRDILACQKALNILINSLKADFVKYKHRVPELRISAAFEGVAHQMGGKFNYSKVGQYTNREIKESIKLLQKAGLVIPITHSSANGIPLGAQENPKKQKFMLLDTGIFQRLLGLQLSNILLSNDFAMINKGQIAERSKISPNTLKLKSIHFMP